MGAVAASALFSRHVGPADTVIDFGCGAGLLMTLLECKTRVGVEPNPAAREVAARHGIRTVAASRELEDAVADVVISNHALEHTLNPLQELRELRRLLRPGGTLALCLPIDDWRAQREWRRDANHHLYTWTPLLIGNLLDEAGFEPRKTSVVTHALPYYNEMLYRLLPLSAFNAVCTLWARIRRQRQLMAVAMRR